MFSYVLENTESEVIGNECPFVENKSNYSNRKISEKIGEDLDLFNWNAKEQGMILGAYYYGFIFSLIPGGYLVERFGCKWIMLVSIWSGVLCTFLSPLVAKFGGAYAFIGLKSFQGLLQGPIFPGTMNMIASWIPPSERSSSVTIIWAGKSK